MNKVALIAGPTASGKTALALELAKKQPSIVINADSAQVYSDLSVLSARPSTEEMGDIPHHLFGYVDGAKTHNAADWAKDAKAAIAQAHKDNLLPILVGGTGMYIRTLLDGIAPIPDITPRIRHEVRMLDIHDAYDALEAEDPESAKRLEPMDSSRISRALEVVRSTGKPISEWHKTKEGGIAGDIDLMPVILLPPRPWLFGRCDRRFELMLDQGALDEVDDLMARNLHYDAPVMRAIGVRDIIAWRKGEMSREEMVAAGSQATRRYAKRQYTWFRNQSDTAWLRWEEEINDKNLPDIVRLFQ